jgi:hypothetical protein
VLSARNRFAASENVSDAVQVRRTSVSSAFSGGMEPCMNVGKLILFVACLAVSLSRTGVDAQEPLKHEVSRTEFGSEYSDGSSTIVGDSALFTPRNGSLILNIDSGRPVYRAVSTLQTRYGYVITYEDPRYATEDDLEDVSASVVRQYSQYPPGAAPRVIVPRRSQLTVALPASPDISPQDLAAVLQKLVAAQASNSRGGHFRVEEAGDVFHVIPTEVRDRNGNWARYSPLLDTLISLPPQDRSEMELYRAIAAAASAAAHVRVEVIINSGIVTGLAGPERRTIMGSSQEPARSVLMRTFQLQRTRRTYALLQGPEDNTPFLNIWDFPTKAQAQPSAAQATSEVRGAPTGLGAPDPSDCLACVPKR